MTGNYSCSPWTSSLDVSPEHRVPADHPFQVTQGEVLFGMHLAGANQEVLVFASHNAYQAQEVKLAFKQGHKSVDLFDREKQQWTPLRVETRRVAFRVEAAAVELVRISR